GPLPPSVLLPPPPGVKTARILTGRRRHPGEERPTHPSAILAPQQGQERRSPWQMAVGCLPGDRLSYAATGAFLTTTPLVVPKVVPSPRGDYQGWVRLKGECHDA